MQRERCLRFLDARLCIGCLLDLPFQPDCFDAASDSLRELYRNELGFSMRDDETALGEVLQIRENMQWQ